MSHFRNRPEACFRRTIRTPLLQQIAFLGIFILGPFAMLASGGTAQAAEKPALTRLTPAGASIGNTTSIEATGTFKDWPVQIWCSLPEIAWECSEKPGTFQVRTPESLAPQIAWVRFFNDAGSTPAKPFLVSSSETVVETDPNDRFTQVERLLPAKSLAFGSIDRTADVDHFRIELQAGEPFYAIVDSARSLKSPLDAHLQLLDSRGNILTEDLDSYGYDPAIEYSPKSAGIYYLRIFGFPIETNSTIAFQGGGDWVYSLHWNTGARPWTVHETNRFTMLHRTEEQFFSTTQAEAKELPLLQPIVQVLSQPKETHYYKLPAMHGKFLRFKLQSQSMGSPLDPVLTVIDSEEKSVAQVDDLPTNRDPMLDWQMPGEGEFWIKVTDFHHIGGSSHAYYLHAEELSPSLSGSIAAESIAGKGAQEFEVAIALERIAAWTGDAEIIATGLPEGSSVSNNKFTITTEGPATQSIKVNIPEAWQGPLTLHLKQTGSDSSIPIYGPNSIPTWLSIAP